MTEVNESIVNAYYTLVKKCLTQTNVKVHLPKEEKDKKSSGWTDIDVLALDIKSNIVYLIEVKGWHNEKFTSCYRKILRIFNNVSENKRFVEKKVRKLLGGNINIKHILVVPDCNEKFKQIALKKGFFEILKFSDILDDLIKQVKENISYEEECLQIIRLLKKYDLLKNDRKS